MSQQERAMVERLDTTGAQTPVTGDKLGGTPLAPVAEQTIAARIGLMSMDSPIHRRSLGLPATNPGTPSTPTAQGAGNRSLAEQTRTMLLSGMTPSQANDLGTVANRRLSAPADILQKQRRQSMLLMHPDKLQDWGHVYLGNPTKADVFVAPSALRRQSGVYVKTQAVEGNCVAIRARVRPRSRDRKPFVIARNFDLDQLRTTIPSPTTSPGSRQQSLTPVSPEDMPGSAHTPTLALVQVPLARGGRRSSMAASGLRVGDVQQTRQGSKEYPIRKSSNPTPLLNFSHELGRLMRGPVWSPRSRLCLGAIIPASIGGHHAFGPYQNRRLHRPAHTVSRSMAADIGICVYRRWRNDRGHQAEHSASWRAGLI